MADAMRALAVVEWGKRAELREMPRPRIDSRGVLVRTHYSGVSVGTEMWIAAGRRKDYGEVPFVNGYQVTGTVVEVGSEVSRCAVGDLVAAFVAGAHSQLAKGREEHVHRLADPSLACRASLFVQPSVGANALSQAGVNTGDSVLVIGQGLVGQMTAQLARLRGAHVLATDVSPERLEISRRHCADVVIDASRERVPDAVRKLFPSGVDVVIESTGFQDLLDDALACCAWNGRFVFEGFYPGTIQYDFARAHAKQLRAFYPVFIGSRESREGVLRLMQSGHLAVDPLVSHLVPWDRSEALYNRLFGAERDSFNGIVFDWTGCR
jgi:2-desacetyl-2-hydroxyethyl bacteriochlorophyllide A dehydrogenase